MDIYKKLADFLQRWTVKASLFKLSFVDVEIEQNLTLGAMVHLKVYDTLPLASDLSIPEGTIIYYDSGTVRHLVIKRASAWRIHSTEGATIS